MLGSANDDLDFPLTGEPSVGGTYLVEPGLLWVHLPLPYRLNHVNAWAIDGGDAWTVIDTGIGDARTAAIWTDLLAGTLAGKPVGRVIATHFHPDHIGQAGWLVERTGASFACSLTDWLFAKALGAGPSPGQNSAAERFYRRAGVDEATIAAVVGNGDGFARAVRAIPPVLERLRHGDELVLGRSAWRVIAGAGHTPEPLCLFRPDPPLLIAGDQVLPRISPNISVWPNEPDADPLRDYLESFGPLLALPEDVLVLPSHGKPFRGLHRRLAALRDHHDDRLRRAAAFCREPRTAADVADALFGGGLDPHQSMFAVGEAIAHLNHLIRRGTLTRRAGPDGVDHYTASAD